MRMDIPITNGPVECLMALLTMLPNASFSRLDTLRAQPPPFSTVIVTSLP